MLLPRTNWKPLPNSGNDHCVIYRVSHRLWHSKVMLDWNHASNCSTLSLDKGQRSSQDSKASPRSRCLSLWEVPVCWSWGIQYICTAAISFAGIKEHIWWTFTGSCIALELGGLAFCSPQQATSSHGANVYSQSCNSLIFSLILYSSMHLRCLSHSLFHKAFKHVLYGMSHQVVSWRMYFSRHWALSSSRWNKPFRTSFVLLLLSSEWAKTWEAYWISLFKSSGAWGNTTKKTWQICRKHFALASIDFSDLKVNVNR